MLRMQKKQKTLKKKSNSVIMQRILPAVFSGGGEPVIRTK